MSDHERDIFEEIAAGLEIDFGAGEPIDYSHLNNIELMREFFRVKHDLADRGVLLHPSEDQDIDEQGHYFALLQEMTNRGLR